MIGRKITSMKRIGTMIAAAALAVGLMLSPMAEQKAYAESLPQPDYTLTVKPGALVDADPNADGKVVADIYKVADGAENSQYLTIDFTAASNYAGVDVGGTKFGDLVAGNPDNTQWRKAGIAVGLKAIENGAGLVQKNVPVGTAVTLEEMGLYVVIAHGVDDNPADYIVENGEEATVATVGEKTYYWVPQLVSVPSPDTVETPEADVMTSDGKWIGDITIEIKPGEKEIPETETETVPETHPETKKTPPKKTPKTGDDTPLSSMMIMGGISLVVLALLGIYVVRSRKNRNNN
jgi:LPXTG-motif cell wall-anchored protein